MQRCQVNEYIKLLEVKWNKFSEEAYAQVVGNNTINWNIYHKIQRKIPEKEHQESIALDYTKQKFAKVKILPLESATLCVGAELNHLALHV